MPDTPLYPAPSQAFARQGRDLAPEIEAAFVDLSQKVFAEDASPAKMKQLVAVAVAHVTQRPYCAKGHTRSASKA